MRRFATTALRRIVPGAWTLMAAWPAAGQLTNGEMNANGNWSPCAAAAQTKRASVSWTLT